MTQRGPSIAERELRVNEKIRAREVRVITDDGTQLGVMSVPAAIQVARERNLDLVEVAPNSEPPVCRLMDYGRFQYEQQKKQREARKHQKTVELKEVRFRPKIDDHDIAFKTRQAQRFLKDGDKVKVTVQFRGREISHPEIGRKVLDQVLGQIADSAIIEKAPSMEGRSMYLILAPSKTQPPRTEKAPAPATTE